jgi:arylformamidase
MTQGWADISLPVAADSVAWSGIPTPRLRFDARIDNGDAVNVGRLDCSLHTGTHADAPFHVTADGVPVQGLDLELYIGPCRVVRLPAAGPDDPITTQRLAQAGVGPGCPQRLLIATGSPYDGRDFPEQIPTLDEKALAWILSLGVRLVGVDVPSVDALASKVLPVHNALFRSGAGILENLDLHAVAPGDYELAAAPILIMGADAAPCRALVRRRSAAA